MTIPEKGYVLKPVCGSQLSVAGAGILALANLGAGEGIWSSTLAGTAYLKSLVAGTNISLSSDANEITINATSATFNLINETEITPTGQDVVVGITGIEGAYLFKSGGTLGDDDSGNARNITNNGAFLANATDGILTRSTTTNSGGSVFNLGFTAHIAVYRTFTDFSIGFWIRNPNAGTPLTDMFFVSDGTANNRYRVRRDTFTFQVELVIGGVTQFAYTADVLQRDNWLHVLFETGSAGNFFYVGGIQQTPTYSTGSSANTQSLADINATSTLTTFDFGEQRMTIDSLYLFNKSLTEDERKILVREEATFLTLRGEATADVIEVSEPTTHIYNQIRYTGTNPQTASAGVLASNLDGYLYHARDLTRCDNNDNIQIGSADLTTLTGCEKSVFITCDPFQRTIANSDENVYIGYFAGIQSSNVIDSVGIGSSSGQVTQGNQSVAVGSNSGTTNQGDSSVAVGYQAGLSQQQNLCTALGSRAGQITQGIGATAVGASAGLTTQGAYSICVGLSSSCASLATNSICIGTSGRLTTPNSILLNSTGGSVIPATAGVYITNIQNIAQPITNILSYNTGTYAVEYTKANQIPIEVLGADPTGYSGRIYYNTADNTLNIYDGSVWRKSGTYT